MTRKVTKQFNVHNAKQFVESLDETANSIYYVFSTRHIEFPNDSLPPTPSDSILDTYYQPYEDMIFGKKVNVADVKHMADKYMWTSGVVYAQYDHLDTTLPSKQFYVTVAESSGYSVFKCLSNNYGAPSTDQPTITETSADDDVYVTTGDGYQWKYMYGITSSEYDKFATSDKIPIIPNANVQANAVAGAIDFVTVTYGGDRYFSVANGVIRVANVAGNTRLFELESFAGANVVIANTAGTFTVERVDLLGKWSNGNLYAANGDPNASNNVANGIVLQANSTFLRVTDVAGNFFGQTSNVVVLGQGSGATAEIASMDKNSTSLSANTDFYKGSSLYTVAGTGSGQIRTVSEYIVTGSARRVLLNQAFSTPVDTTTRWEIGPRVSITGDGQGLEAIARVNTATFAVQSIEVVNRGNNYTWATAAIYGNTGIVESGSTSQANNANVNIIISPKGGHGSDVISELYSQTVGISVDFANTEGGNISVDNDYRQVGILKDPLFANVQLTVANTVLSGGGSGSVTSFADDSIVIQGPANGGAYAVVSGRLGDKLYVSNAYGNFVVSSNTEYRLSDAANTTTTVTEVLTNAGRSTSTHNTFDQRLILVGMEYKSGTQEFAIDEKVVQDSTDAEGYIHSINSTGGGQYTVALTRVRGNWLATDTASGTEYPFRGQTSTGEATFTGFIYKDLVPGSGEIFYIENTVPITRSASQTERIKLMVEF
tara:strand:+ start:6652 stop:8796 length:2145 start_codon:yes stop_codon:yes gene_type:complete